MKTTHWKRNITFFMIGKAATLFGSMLVHYAIMWHITLQTQSGLMITLLAVAGALPMFFISPFGGVWADRYNKKLIINISDAVIALVTLLMAILFALDFEYIGLLLVCSVVRALGQGVQTPAFNALVPDIAPQEHLTRVNAVSGTIQSVVMFASPMAGAAVLAIAPIHALMFIDVVTAAIGISILLFLVKVPAREKKGEIPPGARQYFHEIGEGLKYVKSKAFLKKYLILSALFNIMVAPAAMLTPLQVARNYGDGVWQLFDTVSFGAEQRLAALEITYFVGMMLGGLLLSLWGGFKNKSHTMALSTFLLGLGAVGLGLLVNFWLYIICMGFIGIVMNLFNPTSMAVLQTRVEPDFMGRVFSVLMMMGSLMMPLGMVLWGPLGDIVDIGWLLLGTGIFIFLMGFVFMFDKVLLAAGAPKKTAEE